MRRTGEVTVRFCTRKRGELLRAPFAPSAAKCTREHAGGTHKRAAFVVSISARRPPLPGTGVCTRTVGAMSEKTEWNRGFYRLRPHDGDGGFCFVEIRR